MAVRWLNPVAAIAAIAVTFAIPQSAAAQASIQGRVTSQDGQPVQEARVLLVGTALTAVTGQDGRYALRSVPTGPQTVRVLRVGYVEGRKAATVGANAVVGLDFTLERSVVQLEEIVSTATGARPREELGNAVSSINTSKLLESTPITNISDVLSARVPGVTVSLGSQTGAGARVRIRGNSSLNLSNDPIYIIDGIRMTSNANSSTLFTGGSQPNRINDLNPDEIENMEIVKGPSAATLYGTDAANGVILITTKRGRMGAARWMAYAEGGAMRDNSDYPLNYTIAGRSASTGGFIEAAQCTLSRVAEGSCLRDSVRVYAPVKDPDATPLSWGHRNQIGVNVSGGSEGIRYFLSGEREEETGVIKLPEFEQRRFRDQGLVIRDYNMRPNKLDRYSVRANLNATPRPDLDISLSSALMDGTTRFLLESNATAGLGSQLFGGRGYRNNGNVSGLEAGTPTTPLYGYRAWTPGYTFHELNQQGVTRAIFGSTADWRPLSWMQNRATVGVDYTSRRDYALNRRGEGTPVSSTNRLGYVQDDRTAIRNLTLDVGSSGTWRPRELMQFRTTLGAQYVNYYFEQANADADQLAPGAVTPNAGTILNPTTDATYTKTLGLFVEEQFSWRDRLFLTGALRTDQNSAFGTNFQRVVYPKLSASWIASSEEFFPQYTWLDQLRLRAAWGKSGVQPEPNDALRTFDGGTTSYKNVDQPIVTYTAVGNSSLKPETTSELETGFDLRFLNRGSFEFTVYFKDTKDALISAPIPPSAGAATSVRRNLGAVTNKGFEVQLTTLVYEHPVAAFDIVASYARNDNKLTKLGVDEAGRPLPPIINTEWRAQEDYPLFGFWARPITGWQDKNGDGILQYSSDANLNEVFVGADTVFRGYSSPRYTGMLVPGIEILDRKLRIQSLFEYKGGFKHYNNTERIRCASRTNCAGLSDPNASFEEQATAVAHLELPVSLRTLDGFFEKADFVRLREISATYTLPDRFAARYMRARTASLSMSARNLVTWTSYRGLDPDIDRSAGVSNNAPPDEFQTMGIPTYFVIRVNLGF
jgi:TonB-linked SusC/RagA family outer membrane protein